MPYQDSIFDVQKMFWFTDNADDDVPVDVTVDSDVIEKVVKLSEKYSCFGGVQEYVVDGKSRRT